MAVIRPFRGLRFDPGKAGRLEDLICPPYDVVDEAERKRLVARSSYNLIRVELPQEKPGEPAADADYERAARTLSGWEREGVLTRDPRPALYPYLQGYQGPDGKHRERRGFLAVLRVEDYEGGAVRPHEKTLPKPKEDRFKLLSATQTNVSPVFGLFDDKEGRVAEALARTWVEEPLAELTDAKKIEHRIWRLDAAERQGAICSALGASRVYIADGHHRYETAIRYRNARRDAASPRPAMGTAPFDYVLAYLADVRDPGLAVFPIHRLAKLPAGMGREGLEKGLSRFFEVEPLGGVDLRAPAEGLAAALEATLQARSSREKLFVAYAPGLSYSALLRGKDALATLLSQAGMAKPVAALDVSAVHKAILEETLGVSYDAGTVHFAHSAADAIRMARGEGDRKGFDLAILVNPTRVTEMLAVVDAGETMPQKSTFFYPKPATGMVLNRLDEPVG